MSSRLGAVCLAVGIALIATAMAVTTMAGTIPMSNPVTVVPARLVIWSSCGVLGLLTGLIVSRLRVRPGPTAVPHSPAVPIATVAPTVPSERFGALLEPAEGRV